MVLKYGGLTKRPGTQLVGEVLDKTGGNRLLPFQFSLTQTYALELGQGYMSPVAGGGRLVETELRISNITSAAPAVVTAAAHGYVVGDRVYLAGIAGELGARLNGQVLPVTAILDDNRFAVAANTTGLAPFTSAEGGITRTSAPPPAPPPPTVPAPVPAPTPPAVIRPGPGRIERLPEN